MSPLPSLSTHPYTPNCLIPSNKPCRPPHQPAPPNPDILSLPTQAKHVTKTSSKRPVPHTASHKLPSTAIPLSTPKALALQADLPIGPTAASRESQSFHRYAMHITVTRRCGIGYLRCDVNDVKGVCCTRLTRGSVVVPWIQRGNAA
jgi:hypothetical protein